MQCIFPFAYFVQCNNNGNNLRKALDFEVAGRRGRGLPNLTWKRQVWEHISQIELKREDGIDRVKWCLRTVAKHEVNPVTCVYADKTGFKKLDLSLSLSLQKTYIQFHLVNTDPVKPDIGQFEP